MKLRAPYSPGVVEVPEDQADRYRKAGWREVDTQPAKKAPAKRATRKTSK